METPEQKTAAEEAEETPAYCQWQKDRADKLAKERSALEMRVNGLEQQLADAKADLAAWDDEHDEE